MNQPQCSREQTEDERMAGRGHRNIQHQGMCAEKNTTQEPQCK